MKKFFIASLCKNGILGGGITIDSEAIAFRTGKVTIPQKYRHLVMKYKDICEVKIGWLFVLPAVTIKMCNGEEYKFIVFNRGRFVNAVKDSVKIAKN